MTDVDTIISEYKGGKTLQALAVEFGCSPSSISNVLEKNGVPRRPKGRRPKNGKSKIVEAKTIPILNEESD